MSTEPSRGTQLPQLDFDWMERDIERLAHEYRGASPYPHIVLDDFLEGDMAKKAAGEFPPLDPGTWNNYLHVNERKFSNIDPATWGPTLQAIMEQLNSPRFVRIVEQLMGVEHLFADPSLEGGGLHQSSTGGFLNMHADFTVHPHNRKWRRRANLILYLNEGWQSEWGGDLELWSADMKECVKRVSPIGNRLLIFTTDPTSFHGHPDPMTCPDGVARRSLALYYFTLEADPVARSTDYRARPGDGSRSILIYADKQLLRWYDWAKRRLGLSDQVASRLLAFRDRVRRKGPHSE
jgi:hypothetical protein